MKRTPVFIISNARRFSRFFREDVLLFGNIPRACCVFISAKTKELTMKTKFSVLSIIVLLIGALTLAGCALFQAPQQTAAPANVRTLSVNGTGKVVLVPDIAYINIGVHTEAADVSSSLSNNNDLATAISNALQAEGVELKDIQTSNFNVYPMQQYDNMGQATGTVYVVDNTVSITVRDLSKLGKLLDVAIRSGANNIYGITFDIADRESALASARDLAIKDAQSKAQAVAGVAGVQLGEVQAIVATDSSYVQPYSGYGMGGGGASGLETSVPVSAGQLIITYDVNLTYAIQ